MKIVIAGGSGFIGRAVVTQALVAGHDVVVLSRRASIGAWPGARQPSVVVWDGATAGTWGAALEGAGAVINLSGENIGVQRWSGAQKRLLRETRLVPTRLIVQAIGACRVPPRVLINASAAGYYGNAADRMCDESAPCGTGFLAELCAAWEQAARGAEAYGVRVVMPRMGMVLDRGGALEKLILPFRFYAGGPLGSGAQWMPWITREDLAAAICFLLTHDGLKGPVNCVAPEPSTMTDLCRALGAALHRPCWCRCPAMMLRLVLGEMADVVLSSQRVIPRKLIDAGFRFRQPSLQGALGSVLPL